MEQKKQRLRAPEVSKPKFQSQCLPLSLPYPFVLYAPSPRQKSSNPNSMRRRSARKKSRCKRRFSTMIPGSLHMHNSQEPWMPCKARAPNVVTFQHEMFELQAQHGMQAAYWTKLQIICSVRSIESKSCGLDLILIGAVQLHHARSCRLRVGAICSCWFLGPVSKGSYKRQSAGKLRLFSAVCLGLRVGNSLS